MTIDSSYPTAWAKSVADADAERIYQQTHGRDRRTTAEKMRDEDFKRAAIDFLSAENTIAAAGNWESVGAVSSQMDNADYIEYVKHINEGHKRMKASMDATPTAEALHAANPRHIQGAVGSPAQRGADEKQVSGTHYKDMPIQPWAVMESILTRAEFIGFLKGNVVKYSMRAGRKEGSDDAGKARHYMEKLLEVNR